jgi:hypothetical protein
MLQSLIRRYVFFLAIAATPFFSCKTEKSFIPSYIEIPSVEVDASAIGGNNVHDIKAVQIYINNQTVGTFAFPCKFPVNASGFTKIEAVAFVKINGNSQTLVPYKSLEILTDTLDLLREKSTKWIPKFTYRGNVRVVWQEDFEDSSSSLVPANTDSLNIHGIQNRPFYLNDQFSGNSLVYVSQFNLPDSFQMMDLKFFQRIKNLPNDGRDAILEFDIKTDLPVLVQLLPFNPSPSEFIPYLTINPTQSNWRRFYINLVYDIQGKPSTNEYEIFFSVDKVKDFKGSTEILIDNIRLTHL